MRIETCGRRWARTGVVLALGFLSLGLAASLSSANAQIASERSAGEATTTSLTAVSRTVAGQSAITYVAEVRSGDGSPATGAVTLTEQGRALAGAALDAAGKAEIRFDALPAGEHALEAVYGGDASHAGSKSDPLEFHSDSVSPAFTLGINVVGSTNPTTMTIAVPGQTGYLNATVTPTGGFTGFISLSCSGPSATSGAPGGSALPVGVSCTFTPANLEVNSTAAVTAQMSLQTTAGQQNVAAIQPLPGLHGKVLALAILLPGILGLGILGRKRKLLARVSLLAFVAAIGVLGTSSCAARYKYLNHGPTFSGTTPGTYTLTITAQTSNGVTASTQSQTLTLIVQ